MPSFPHQLRRIRRLLRGSRLLSAVLAAAALAAGLWLLFGLADAWLAFEATARVAITAALAVSILLFLFILLARAVRVPAATAAALADAALGDPRRPVSAAFSLTPTASPLGAHLSGIALEAAAARLAALPARRVIPWRTLRRGLAALAVPPALAALLWLALPQAFNTIASRLLHPAADIPPYSPLVFTVDPAQPTAVYGRELLVAAEITGGKPTQPVECLVRQPRSRKILRLPAFRESPTRFSRTLDGLTEPLEIAFACGKARSLWHPVEILLEPEILGGIVRLRPPDYTGLPPSEFPLDTTEVAALEGSTITLELTSNRPLGSGSLVFTTAAMPGSEATRTEIQATLANPHAASFTWTATQPGRLAATLRDLRGTPNPRPLELAFRCLPDQAPTVALTSPPALLLATPKSRIPVRGRAEDDFALSKVHFVRTLAGFRDRSRLVAPALRDATFDFSDLLDLESLGLDAGQTIELMLDASDHNPSLLGQGSSEISRIHIISEDQYAAHIRAKTTIDQFAKRFQAAREAMDEARKALEKLKEAAAKGDREAARMAAEDAARAHEQAAGLLEKIAEDFQAFELEKRLKELAEKQAADLRENLDALRNLNPEAPGADQQAAIEEMLKRLQRRQPEAEQLDEDVAKVRQAATLLEMAAKFRQIYESQASLAKRFGTIVEELRRGEDQNRRLLPSLAETQQKNREALDAFKAELRRRAEALPNDDPDLTPLIDSALQFLQELEVAEPETMMDAAARHGKAGEAMDAFTQAELARAALERLMSEPEPFAQAARGQAPQFKIPRPDVNRNLQQMLEALLGQNPGAGQGDQPGGQGMGPAGMGLAGSPGGGFPMDMPVVGPERLQFGDSPGSSPGGNGKQGGQAAAPLPDTAESATLKPTESRHGQPTTPTPDAIPEPYREAVKKFLTP